LELYSFGILAAVCVINVCNRLYMQKICLSDVGKFQTCLSTSQVPSSGSPLISHCSTLKMVCCTLSE